MMVDLMVALKAASMVGWMVENLVDWMVGK